MGTNKLMLIGTPILILISILRVNSTYKWTLLLGVLCSDCGGLEDGHIRVIDLQVPPMADGRHEIPQALFSCEDCSSTCTELWLT